MVLGISQMRIIEEKKQQHHLGSLRRRRSSGTARRIPVLLTLGLARGDFGGSRSSGSYMRLDLTIRVVIVQRDVEIRLPIVSIIVSAIGVM